MGEKGENVMDIRRARKAQEIFLSMAGYLNLVKIFFAMIEERED